eukprot:c33245_g1_i1.p3 GENE.c33245_g1_i1~~c33245_g1_i1.p3  ORF type:complete len:119 (-),score=15.80 c33245_g1_i1:51-407(-)
MRPRSSSATPAEQEDRRRSSIGYRGAMSEGTLLPERSRLVQQHLVDAGVDTTIRVLPDSARTAAEAAAAIGCDVAAIANSLVFLADGEPVLVMTSGGHRADFAVLTESKTQKEETTHI